MDVFELPCWSTSQILQMIEKLFVPTSLIKFKLYIIIEPDLLEVHDYIPHDKNKRLYSSVEIPSNLDIISIEEHTYYKKYAMKAFPRFSSLLFHIKLGFTSMRTIISID